MKVIDSLGELCGMGNTADVYDAGGGKVLKLFHPGYESCALAECRNAMMLNSLENLPVTHCHGLAEYGRQTGVLYDRAEGVCALDEIQRTGNFEDCIRIAAALHKRLLQAKLPEAVSIKTILYDNIAKTGRLDSTRKEELLRLLKTLPDGGRLCHGDFHVGNILTSKQKSTVIDYLNICRGPAEADIARTVYLTQMTPVPADCENPEKMGKIKREAAALYLKEMGIEPSSLRDWLTVTAAGRLAELRDDQRMEIESILRYLDDGKRKEG